MKTLPQASSGFALNFTLQIDVSYCSPAYLAHRGPWEASVMTG